MKALTLSASWYGSWIIESDSATSKEKGLKMKSFVLNSRSFWRRTIWLSLGRLRGSSANASSQTANWPQWGGPQRNFMVEAKGLAESWPAGGPKRLWSRALGEGHSSVVVDGERLYTMYSQG